MHIVTKIDILNEIKSINAKSVNIKCKFLNKLLFFLRSENFYIEERKIIFFSLLKLFEYDSTYLKILNYKCLLELGKIEEYFILTSTLLKDINAIDPYMKMAAYRVLFVASDINDFERYVKQGILDTSLEVRSTVMVQLLHKTKSDHGAANRFLMEIQENLSHENTMTSYHSLGLLANLKKDDEISLEKFLLKTIKLKNNSYALSFLIRSCRAIQNDIFDKFLIACLDHIEYFVVYEAACILAERGKFNIIKKTVEQFAISDNPIKRLAAVRILRVSENKEKSDLLQLLANDENKSVSYEALKVMIVFNSELAFEVLKVKLILQKLSQEEKIALMNLIFQYSKNAMKNLDFYAQFLSPNSEYRLLEVTLNNMKKTINENCDLKDIGLNLLSGYLDDPRNTNIAIEIIHYIGEEAAKINNGNYTRILYNAAMLEDTPIRVAAITAISKMTNKHCVKSILQIFKSEDDNFVRDRAVFHDVLTSY